MDLAIIGLGRMGLNMMRRLQEHGHRVVAFDRSPEAREKARAFCKTAVSSISEIKNHLAGPRIAWVMVPHGAPTDAVVDELAQTFEHGDIIIDGGNSHFLSSIARAKTLSAKKINFVDVGVSGGVFGLERGYCLMVGGDEKVVSMLTPIFSALAPKTEVVAATKSRTQPQSTAHLGYLHCGPVGAGHYVKMIHNAIEYGMMQAYAEGLDVLSNASSTDLAEDQRYSFDLREICELWRRGSVVSSWLLDLLADALHKDPTLENFSGQVPDSGEGRFALMEAIKQGTPSPGLTHALFTRFRSRQTRPLAERALSALRKEFGGHDEGPKK